MSELIFLGSDDDATAQKIAEFLATLDCAKNIKLVFRVCKDSDALAAAFNAGYDAAHAGGAYDNPHPANTSENHFYQDGWNTYKSQMANLHRPKRYNGVGR